jgi:hypothetical protein
VEVDPNANLEMQMRLSGMIIEKLGAGPMNREEVEQFLSIAEQLAEHVEALNGWIVKGGALPKAWEKAK